MSWWVSTYIYFSLTGSIACLNYSLRHIFSSSLCQLGGNQSIMSSFGWNIQLKHWSIKCYGWFVGFLCSLLLNLGYQCGVDSLHLLKSVVNSSSDSPIDLGLKLSTQKRVLWIFKYIGYTFRFMKLNNVCILKTFIIILLYSSQKLWELLE